MTKRESCNIAEFVRIIILCQHLEIARLDTNSLRSVSFCVCKSRPLLVLYCCFNALTVAEEE